MEDRFLVFMFQETVEHDRCTARDTRPLRNAFHVYRDSRSGLQNVGREVKVSERDVPLHLRPLLPDTRPALYA